MDHKLYHWTTDKNSSCFGHKFIVIIKQLLNKIKHREVSPGNHLHNSTPKSAPAASLYQLFTWAAQLCHVQLSLEIIIPSTELGNCGVWQSSKHDAPPTRCRKAVPAQRQSSQKEMRQNLSVPQCLCAAPILVRALLTAQVLSEAALVTLTSFYLIPVNLRLCSPEWTSAIRLDSQQRYGQRPSFISLHYLLPSFTSDTQEMQENECPQDTMSFQQVMASLLAGGRRSGRQGNNRSLQPP